MVVVVVVVVVVVIVGFGGAAAGIAAVQHSSFNWNLTDEREMFLELLGKVGDGDVVGYGDDGDGSQIGDIGRLRGRRGGHGHRRRGFALQRAQNARAQQVHQPRHNLRKECIMVRNSLMLGHHPLAHKFENE